MVKLNPKKEDCFSIVKSLLQGQRSKGKTSLCNSKAILKLLNYL